MELNISSPILMSMRETILPVSTDGEISFPSCFLDDVTKFERMIVRTFRL